MKRDGWGTAWLWLWRLWEWMGPIEVALTWYARMRRIKGVNRWNSGWFCLGRGEKALRFGAFSFFSGKLWDKNFWKTRRLYIVVIFRFRRKIGQNVAKSSVRLTGVSGCGIR